MSALWPVRIGLEMRKEVDYTELLMKEKMKKVKITMILIQVGWENSGTILSNFHGSFVLGT